MGSKDTNIEVKKPEEEEINDFYDWELVPTVYPDESKTGVTFKGDSKEYVKAQGMVLELFNKKGAKYFINEREIRILDNVKNKPIKMEVKPLKGETGKVNIKLYKVNNQGGATIMISKPTGGSLLHVKTLAFKVVKYLLILFFNVLNKASRNIYINFLRKICSIDFIC